MAKPNRLIIQMRKHAGIIAKERDALRDLIDDASALDDACQRAQEALEEAIQILSEQV